MEKWCKELFYVFRLFSCGAQIFDNSPTYIVLAMYIEGTLHES